MNLACRCAFKLLEIQTLKLIGSVTSNTGPVTLEAIPDLLSPYKVGRRGEEVYAIWRPTRIVNLLRAAQHQSSARAAFWSFELLIQSTSTYFVIHIFCQAFQHCGLWVHTHRL